MVCFKRSFNIAARPPNGQLRTIHQSIKRVLCGHSPCASPSSLFNTSERSKQKHKNFGAIQNPSFFRNSTYPTKVPGCLLSAFFIQKAFALILESSTCFGSVEVPTVGNCKPTVQQLYGRTSSGVLASNDLMLFAVNGRHNWHVDIQSSLHLDLFNVFSLLSLSRQHL